MELIRVEVRDYDSFDLVVVFQSLDEIFDSKFNYLSRKNFSLFPSHLKFNWFSSTKFPRLISTTTTTTEIHLSRREKIH